jgi:hypothetical protein
MTESTAVRVVEIKSADELRSIGNEFKSTYSDVKGWKEIRFGDRGRLPMRDAAKLFVSLQLAGEIKIVDTDYYPITEWALGGTVSPHKSRDGFSYVITYSVKGVDGTHTLTLTDDAVNEYLPNVKGKVGGAYATMLLALHLNAEDENTLLSVLTNYSVKDVTRIATPSESDVKKTEDAPKGDDTGEQVSDADKATETPEDVKAPEVTEPVKVETVADEVKVPVPAEAAPKPAARKRNTTTAKPRAAKPTAKAANKA